jgi:hypothetical protein
MLNEERLKNSLIAAYNEEAEEADADAAVERIMEKVAKAIIQEIKQLNIIYTTGLVAGANPVIGQLQHTIQ